MELVSKSIPFVENEKKEVLLHNLPVGKKGRVRKLLNSGQKRRRLLDLGLIPNSIVKTELISPLGNPIAYNIRGSVIALRKEETRNVVVEIIDKGES
ncbi:FeoA family protein [Thermohalobacter berrensis]|uniref:Iron transporter FeoA n=1 Tax=Thermohalobacter berrensis TaxID=99594 RepID=A0A419T9P2_9FIRM|nr:FeoA family protein [Thermohalobacter berrensis]RKD34189.1 iron transporter FeoA [Thermohalobacter berrensis]